ncbi:hypothetical protein JHK82_037328 [Glycine max]|nr:hypothetical protein JHK86_037524 [Glycine max]KAG5114059.1 hypothetical protein JHK82_037328 [Glycine max]KAG5131340.1 hypothetical protein JHK84_037737 [Glycine max]
MRMKNHVCCRSWSNNCPVNYRRSKGYPAGIFFVEPLDALHAGPLVGAIAILQVLTAIRRFAAEFAAAYVVLFASKMKLPISASQMTCCTINLLFDQTISQAVQSTSNLLHLMRHSSPAQAQLVKLPKNLLAKVSTIKNTEQVLEQLPGVISSLDAHMENGLQNVPHLKTVVQVLSNMESSQLSLLSRPHPLQKELEPGNQSQGTG